MNIREFIESKVEKNPDKPFLYFEDKVISYEAFDQKINQAANGFLEMGVNKGERVCLMLPNRPEFLYGWFGLAKIGAVMVPINTAFKENEAGYIVHHSESVGIIADANLLPIARALKGRCPKLKWICCVDQTSAEGIFPFAQIFQRMEKALKPIRIRDEDMAQIIYTSGTTGFPKGAIHGQKDFTLTGEAFTLCAGIGPEDRLLTNLPLFHVNAEYYSTMGALAAEASLILIPRFSATLFWDQAIYYGATEFNFIGAIGRILCTRPEEEFRPGHQIKTAYGAPVTPDVYETFTQRFRIQHVIEGYGLTEVPRVSQNPIDGVIKTKSMGLPARHPSPNLKFAEVKIVDEQGKELGPGEAGELIVRSPVMMQGYFKDEEKTQETIRDGWLYTGDYAFKGEDDYLYFVDRKKDIIRRKGENISATEVEFVLQANEKIFEAAVIAVPSELGEDEVLAAIVLKENQTITPEEVIAWCQDHLANFKVPRYVQFRSSLPKTPTERVAKYVLKQEADLIPSSHDMMFYKKRIGV
ncbi:MAG: AMP-binding protein [Deltaproteobacteria bacterium]|nr:AMP-binding protein [Deltaproteobacteria bacterium]